MSNDEEGNSTTATPTAATTIANSSQNVHKDSWINTMLSRSALFGYSHGSINDNHSSNSFNGCNKHNSNNKNNTDKKSDVETAVSADCSNNIDISETTTTTTTEGSSTRNVGLQEKSGSSRRSSSGLLSRAFEQSALGSAGDNEAFDSGEMIHLMSHGPK